MSTLYDVSVTVTMRSNKETTGVTFEKAMVSCKEKERIFLANFEMDSTEEDQDGRQVARFTAQLYKPFGMYEADFAKHIASKIRLIVPGFKKIEVQLTCLENLPVDEFSFTPKSFRSKKGRSP